jgi:hypothetical protein
LPFIENIQLAKCELGLEDAFDLLCGSFALSDALRFSAAIVANEYKPLAALLSNRHSH